MTTFHMKTEKDLQAPIETVDCSQKIWPIYRLVYDDDHRLVIMEDGARDVQAEIDANAARVVSLSELCDGLPGGSPLEKLNYALENGLLPKSSEGDTVTDLTEIPGSITDLANTGNAARSMLGGQKGNLEELINAMVKEALAKQEAAQSESAAEGEK